MTNSLIRKRHEELLICLLLITACLSAYGQIATCDFINYDDGVYVTENPHVKSGLTRESITWALTTGHSANWHPLTWLSHMLDIELYGLNPMGHHWTNLQIHIANTILLFLVLKMMTGATWPSAFVAALFALHPLHVQSVAWISERKDVLSTFFWILSMWAYVRYTRYPAKMRYLVLIIFFILGLMSKPMLVTMPFVLLLLDFWPLKRIQLATYKQQGKGFKTPLALIREKIPLFVLSGVSSLITFCVQQHGGTVKSLQVFPLKIRVANTLVSYLGYIEKMIWPQKLAIFYPYPETLPIAQAILSGLLLLCLSALIIWSARRLPYLATGWLWYLGTMVPVIGLVQVGSQSMADRYTYVPLIGLFIMSGWGMSDISAKWRSQKTALTLFSSGVLISLMLCTWFQVGYWQNSITLFTHTLKVTHNNNTAHYHLGQALDQEGKLDEAIIHYSKALQIEPKSAMVHNNLGATLARQENIKGAIHHFYEALQINPNYVEAHNNLAVMLLTQDKLDEAVLHYTEALRIDPENAVALNNLATVLSTQGKLDEVALHYTKVLMIDPENADAHYNLGRLLIKQEKLKEAMGHFAEVIKIDPGYARAYNEAGIVLAQQGQLKNARAFFSKAIRINPNFSEARTNLFLLNGMLRSNNKSAGNDKVTNQQPAGD